MSVETEVKFFLTDPIAVREKILSIGATSSGNHFETNIRFEDADHTLIARRALLRLRQYHKAILTFKSEPAVADKNFKTYEELEVEVSDFHTTRQILTALGFHEEQVYEKYREVFNCQNTLLCLDTMPYGDFLEIEGDKTSIRDIADQLDVPWEQRILTNYLNIFEHIRDRHALPFTDITFNNFKTVTDDCTQEIISFYANLDRQ